jgi:hypothetical protein
MTQTLGTDSNNDIHIGIDGNVVLLSGVHAVLAACETASKAQLGEMVLATGNGIPNFQAVWVGSPNYAIFQSYLRSTLLKVDGVIDVESLTLTVKEGILSYYATIKTQYGTAALNG